MSRTVDISIPGELLPSAGQDTAIREGMKQAGKCGISFTSDKQGKRIKTTG